MKRLLLLPIILMTLTSVAQRSITPSDIYKIRSISDPQVSPDGKYQFHGFNEDNPGFLTHYAEHL